jgi:ketosteroid isomerase-like protein
MGGRGRATKQNVEVILRGVAATNRRDSDAFVACLHHDVEWQENGDSFPGLGGVYRGRAAVRAWFDETFGSLWESSHTQVEEIIEAGDERVLLGFLRTARGRASGVETNLRGWNVFWFANGKIARREGPFWDRAQGPRGRRPAGVSRGCDDRADPERPQHLRIGVEAVRQHAVGVRDEVRARAKQRGDVGGVALEVLAPVDGRRTWRVAAPME